MTRREKTRRVETRGAAMAPRLVDAVFRPGRSDARERP